MATVNLNKEELAKRRRFLLLCGVGAVVVVLGMMAPRMVAPMPEASPIAKNEPIVKGSEKAAPPLKKLASEQDQAPKSTELPEAPGLGAILTRLAGGTVIVLALCALSAYGMGRWLKGKKLEAPKGPLKLVAALPLNSRCSIILLQAGDQHIVAGMDATGLRTMLHLAGGIGEPEDDRAPPRAEEVPPAPQPFETVPAAFTVPSYRAQEPPMQRVEVSGKN